MGHRKYSAPRRGSLAYAPRKRAGALLLSVKHWPASREGVGLQGFIAYKAGMTSVFHIDDVPGSPTQGSEIQSAATLLAAPPAYVVGIVLYGDDGYGGLREITRAYAKSLPAELTERVKGIKPGTADRAKLEGLLDRAREVRVILASIPREAGLSQKKPYLLEVKVSGGLKEAFEYAMSKLGGRVSAEEVFSPGQFVDVIAVTRGQGFQGVVKRFKVKELPRKQRKTRRAVGAIGGRKPPYVTRFVPRAGQMGFHRRTEFNKRILSIESDGSKLTPSGGLKHFGVINSPCIVVLGSVPGTAKRPVILRVPARQPRYKLQAPTITAITYGGEVLA